VEALSALRAARGNASFGLRRRLDCEALARAIESAESPTHGRAEHGIGTNAIAQLGVEGIRVGTGVARVGIERNGTGVGQTASSTVVSPAPGAPRTATARVRTFANLTKPRLLPLVLFTGLPIFGMAAGGWPSLGFACLVLLGIALAAASANTLNAFLERDTDARMERTRNRPLPAGEISPRAALLFGLGLGVLSTGLLFALAGLRAAGVAIASIAFYVFVYTIWLKPRSAWSAVIGGAAGAAAPLMADVAMNGTVTVAGLSLFAIVFFWQPPHVWAIALYRKREYAAAGLPMLPSVIGDEATRWRMLWYTVGLVPVTLLPWAFGFVGPAYLAVALGMNAWFVGSVVRLLRERSDAAAQRVFRVSLAYLFALFLAMNLDLLARL
jgi:protoheme IX farnesyltransferase